MNKNLLRSFGASILLLPTAVQAGSYAINGVVFQTVDSNNPANAAIPGSSSGSASNTNTWATGVVGRFILKDAFNNDYGLEVSATNPTGALSAGTDSLMVAQTVNSQGLTDRGTLSVYARPSSTNPYSLDLKFSFFSGTTFTTPASLNVLLTSLDIDFSQRYYTKNTDFTSNSTYAGTDLTSAPAVAGYTGFTASGNSTFDNPRFAVSSAASEKSELNIRIAHNSVALFMFEFRDPSQIVPEPSSLALLGLGTFGLAFRRRRSA
jgi:hypothetical protein